MAGPVPSAPRGRALLAGLSEASRLLDNRSPVGDAIEQALSAPPSALTASPPPAAEARRLRKQAGAYRDLGERLLRERRWVDAASALRQAVRSDPEDVTAWHALGCACLEARLPGEAADALMRVIERKPDDANAHFVIGMAFEALGDLEPAVVAFRHAAELMPDSLEAASRVANLLAMFDQREEAAEWLMRAAEHAPAGTAAGLARARAFGLRKQPEAAEAALRSVLAQDPANASAWTLLGVTLATLGRIEESAAASRRAVELDASQAAAFLELARAGRIGESDGPLLARITALLPDSRLTLRQRMQLHFALGKVHDDRGESAEAMAQFDAANVIRHRLVPFDRAAATGLVDRAIATFTPAFLSTWAGHGLPDERPLLVVGMPRSGTTLAEQVLSSHPAVAAAGEMQFWTKHSNRWPSELPPNQTPALIGRLAAEYRAALHAISADAARVTDKNPYNFLALGPIRLAFPNAYVVHCRRNPVDTCLSLYTTFIGSRTEFASRRGDLVFFYRLYQRLMAHWRAVLPPDRFFELDYEALIGDREAMTRRLVAFCGLDWDPACLQPEQNRRVVHTASLYQARRPVYTSSVERWRRYEPWLGELRELLEDEATGAAA